MYRQTLKAARRTLLVASASVAILAAVAAPAMAGRWVTGDIHNHTVLTDGSSTFTEVTRNAFSVYGLDYLANSEHGGTSSKDPAGLSFVSPVWRWITLSNYSFPQVLAAREDYAERSVLQGLEWNAPTHEHVSVGIVGAGNEPNGISDFEYHFDASDMDMSRAGESTKELTHKEPDPADPTKTITVVDVPAMTFGKYNTTHQDMLTAVDWLEQSYGPESYAIVNHPSRKNLWHVGDFRAMNDVAPDVAIGFEGLPGHQAAQARGEYGNFVKSDGTLTSDPAQADATLTAHARTYGGADWMTATVGGLWDSLLGEGRNWWIFNNSDYHTVSTAYKDAEGTTIGLQYQDFWPGQYGKTHTYVGKLTNQGVVNGMHSGNVWVVNGDLIKDLKFTVTDGKRTATMGGTLGTTAGKTLTVSIAVKSPKVNENGDRVKLDHVDLISGNVTGLIPASDPAYTASETNASTKVAKTFGKSAWKAKQGWKVMTYKVKATTGMYFRLRGTTWASGANPTQIDAQGNPVVDEMDYVDYPNPKTGGVKADGSADLIHGNTPDNAWADLWFYSNPVFVYVK